jgi:outer membrane protein assembly factor BamB
MRAAVWLALVVVPLAAGCASRAVREPPAPLAEFKPAFQVDRIWSASVGASTKEYLGLVPTVTDATVYAAGPEGRVSALATDSGSPRWQTDLDIPISGAVGVGKTLVAVGTRDGHVIALKRADGKRAWIAMVSSEVLAPPAVSDGVVVAQTVDGRLTGLSAADGKRLWIYERSEPALSLRGTDTPVLTANAVLAGFASGRLAAIRLEDGQPLWETVVAQPRGRNEIERLVDVDVPPVVFADAIYVASYQGKLVAINPDNGNIIWSRDVSTFTGIATDGINLYLTDDRGYVLAFDRRSGASVWRQEGLHGRRLNAPVTYDDAVVVADYEGYVHWLSREDGHFLARYQAVDSAVRAPGVVSGKTVMVAGISGTLAALRLVQK